MTYPIAFKAGSAVTDTGDPLLNSWILAWDVKKIVSGEITDLFNANIFYPYKKTLAYSEHMFSNALIALPVTVITGNPLLAYNFVLLFSFFMSGFGMYLLGQYLTGSAAAGIVAGITFAFSPFMFDHLPHLQVISAGWIPIAFLFLHKFFKEESYKNLLLFTLFYLLQVLANGHYALYLTLFSGCYILYHVIRQRKYKDFKFLRKMALFALLVVIIAGPFFYPYIVLRSEMGFVRKYVMSADVTSFLTVNPMNWLYGRVIALPSYFYRGESSLFPGIIVLILAMIGLKSSIQKNKKHIGPSNTGKGIVFHLPLKWIVNLFIVFYITLIGVILVTGGFDHSLRIRAHNLNRPLMFLMMLVFLRFIIESRARHRVVGLIRSLKEPAPIYFFILLSAFLFSFGKDGPYILLYKFVPGFDGLRVATRFHIFVMFSLGVFAAFGYKALFSGLKGFKKSAVFCLTVCLLIVEYFSMPLHVDAVPVKNDIPMVYQWLAKQDEDFAIIELPIPKQKLFWKDIWKVYYSAYHWKKLLNGYSGYFSPLYLEMRERMQRFPSEQTLKDLKSIDIKYIILHSSSYDPVEWQKILAGMPRFDKETRFIKRFEEDYVYELLDGEKVEKWSLSTGKLITLPKDGWTVNRAIF